MNLYEMKQAFAQGKTIFDLPLRVSYYARVSTEKEEQINSLENQVNFFREYINKNKNWTLVNSYIDEGISGTTSRKRENFIKMIEDSKNGIFDLIVTKEVSRFSRDTIDSLFYTRKLLEYNVCVYFLSDNIITASNDGELRLTIMSSMAQDEVRKISERTKFGLKRAMEKGVVLGTNNIWGYRKENGKLVIDENEAKLIRKIFELYVNNKWGLKKLSEELAKEGYYNHNGNLIHQNTLKNIILNPKYKGYYTGGLSTVINYRTKKRNYYSQDEIKIYKDNKNVPPIVSEELWEKANKKLLERSKSAKKYRKHQTIYTLSGKIFCLKHKCTYIRKIKHYKNKRDVIYWYCCNFHKTGKKDGCNSYLKEEYIYDLITNYLKKYEIYKEEVCKNLLELYSKYINDDEKVKEQIQLKKKIDNLDKKQEKLLDLFLDEIITKDEYGNKIEKIKEQKINITKKLEKLINKYDFTKEEYIKYLQEKIIEETEISRKNIEEYIENLVNKIIVENNGNIKIYLDDKTN